jgi:hypothetical protein
MFKNPLNQKEQLHFRQGPHNQELMLLPKLPHIKKITQRYTHSHT